MSRLKADLTLLFVAVVWGLAFLFQKQGVTTLGVFTFVGLRFAISVFLVLPLAWREFSRSLPLPPKLKRELLFLCAVFVAGVILQHAGLKITTVTHAGFLTGLYVLFVALICRFLYRQNVSRFVFQAAVLSVAGVGLLSGGGDLSQMNFGDLLVILCAVAFGFQVALIGRIMAVWPAPYTVSFLQYILTALVAGILAWHFEDVRLENIFAARFSLLYAGVLSGGVAYTLQVVAQQFAPAADAAVIMSLESLFAAVLGVWINGDVFTGKIALGAALILIAIVLVELGPKTLAPGTKNH